MEENFVQLDALLERLKRSENNENQIEILKNLQDTLNKTFPQIHCDSISVNVNRGWDLYGIIVFPSIDEMKKISDIIANPRFIENKELRDTPIINYDIEFDNMILNDELIKLSGSELCAMLLYEISHIVNGDAYFNQLGIVYHKAALDLGYKFPTTDDKLKKEYLISVISLFIYDHIVNNQLLFQIKNNRINADDYTFVSRYDYSDSMEDAINSISKFFTASMDNTLFNFKKELMGSAKIFVFAAENYNKVRNFVKEQIRILQKDCTSEILGSRLNVIDYKLKALLDASLAKRKLINIKDMMVDTLESYNDEDIVKLTNVENLMNDIVRDCQTLDHDKDRMFLLNQTYYCMNCLDDLARKRIDDEEMKTLIAQRRKDVKKLVVGILNKPKLNESYECINHLVELR